MVPLPETASPKRGALSFLAACADGYLKVYAFNDGCRDSANPKSLQAVPPEASWEHHRKASTSLHPLALPGPAPAPAPALP